MSDLNPTEIYHKYQRKELDKTLAVSYLKSFIENSNDEDLRVRSVELLGGMDLDVSEIFEFFEHLLTIGTSEILKSEVITILYRDFREISKQRLLTFFKGGASPDCLFRVYNALAHKKTESVDGLINFMEETIDVEDLVRRVTEINQKREVR